MGVQVRRGGVALRMGLTSPRAAGAAGCHGPCALGGEAGAGGERDGPAADPMELPWERTEGRPPASCRTQMLALQWLQLKELHFRSVK